VLHESNTRHTPCRYALCHDRNKNLSIPAFWRFDLESETFADFSAARRAETSLSVVAEARGKVWLLTIGPKGTRTPGATFVTEVGPLLIPAASEYEMIVLDGDLPANANVLVHTHSGPEAWYVLSGKQCLDLPGRAVRAIAGEGMFAPADPP